MLTARDRTLDSEEAAGCVNTSATKQIIGHEADFILFHIYCIFSKNYKIVFKFILITF